MKISLKIERFENDEAILRDAAGLAFSWPKNKLPFDAKEKDELLFNISSPAEAEKENSALAKNILNEILGDG
jgi:hypothetical protein